MPIYEYRPIQAGCKYCGKGFDVLQKISDPLLQSCPRCGAGVRRVISRFSASVSEPAGEAASLDGRLNDFESEGKWSHAAELADKAGLKERAMDDYKKAGYNF
ncbi:MAG: zinc ribbon domain-containing protein [Chloroflexi bacterium]|nr:zinc ribbon domain-containing protein [Chloroflexota bacterium]